MCIRQEDKRKNVSALLKASNSAVLWVNMVNGKQIDAKLGISVCCQFFHRCANGRCLAILSEIRWNNDGCEAPLFLIVRLFDMTG